ncbi:MAG: hypothetical protein EOP61_11000 [Sphingomonadales bacterium]|nr:MAG: hypothetical protein EOP61_11000 [Sphingomonadales bacterium]
MPVYHFHIVDGTPTVPPDVLDFANLAAARSEACRLFADLVRENPKLSHGAELRVQLTDAGGMALFDLTLLVTEAPVLRAG